MQRGDDIALRIARDDRTSASFQIQVAGVKPAISSELSGCLPETAPTDLDDLDDLDDLAGKVANGAIAGAGLIHKPATALAPSLGAIVYRIEESWSLASQS